jgi:hypothetical protein
MTNDMVFIDYTCPNCYSMEHKLLPKGWNEQGLITEFYNNFYFCLQCGLHTSFTPKLSKTYA